MDIPHPNPGLAQILRLLTTYTSRVVEVYDSHNGALGDVGEAPRQVQNQLYEQDGATALGFCGDEGWG